MEIFSIFLILVVYLLVSVCPAALGNLLYPLLAWRNNLQTPFAEEHNVKYYEKKLFCRRYSWGAPARPGIPPVLPKVGQLGLCLSRIWGAPPSHLISRPHSKLQEVCTFSGEVLSKEAFPHLFQDGRSCALDVSTSPLSCLHRGTTVMKFK